MKNKVLAIQQGDVFMERVDSIPEGAVERQTNVLAEGEATGHSHRIFGEGVKVMEHQGKLFISAPKGAEVVHEEHKPQTLPPGFVGVVRITQEYDHFQEEARNVAD